MALWKEEGVDTSAVKKSPIAHTGLYFVTHGPDGHVFSYMRAGSAASRMTPDDMPADAIKAAKVVHASGISQAISSSAADAVFAAFRIGARGQASTVSYDTNLRLRLWPLDRARAVIHAAAGLADILKAEHRRRAPAHRPRRSRQDRRLLPRPRPDDRRADARRRRRHRGDARRGASASRRARRSSSMRPAPATCSTARSSPSISAPAIRSPPAATPTSPRRCRPKATARSRRCRSRAAVEAAMRGASCRRDAGTPLALTSRRSRRRRSHPAAPPGRPGTPRSASRPPPRPSHIATGRRRDTGRAASAWPNGGMPPMAKPVAVADEIGVGADDRLAERLRRPPSR